jgi:hypothetical protein
MNIDRCLHSFSPEGSPAELDVPEFLLQFFPVRELLSYVDNFPEGSRLADWPDLRSPLPKSNQLTRVVEVQYTQGAQSKDENLVEKGRKEFQEKSSIHRKFLLYHCLGQLLQDVDGEVVHPTRRAFGGGADERDNILERN